MASSSIQLAPGYGHHRQNITVADSLPESDAAHGVNCADHRYAMVQVVPKTGAGNPTATVLFWSEEKGEFIAPHSALSYAGKGVGVAYEFDVDVKGRIMFIALSGTMTGGIDVFVSGYGLNHTE